MPSNYPSEHMEPTSSSPKKRSHLVSNILIVVGVLLLVVAGVMYGRNMWNYHQIDEENERVAQYAKLSDDSEIPPEVDWEALKANNPDVVGWLQVPGTIVNYPVYQADNNEYYLDHAPDRSQSIGGAVFLDYENTAPGMVDGQTIIYGHHMRNGSQFKPIADMENQTLFDGVKTVWYVTEKGAYKLAPLFLYYTHEGDVDVRTFQFSSADEYQTYLKTYLGKAVTKRSDIEEILPHLEHILTLSTCNYYDNLGRTLLVCAPKSEIPGTPEYDASAASRAAQAEAKAKADAEAAARAQAEAEAALKAEQEKQQEPAPEEIVEIVEYE